MKKATYPIFALDGEEQELSDSFDRGEWVSVENLEEEKAIARRAASHYFFLKQKDVECK